MLEKDLKILEIKTGMKNFEIKTSENKVKCSDDGKTQLLSSHVSRRSHNAQYVNWVGFFANFKHSCYIYIYIPRLL